MPASLYIGGGRVPPAPLTPLLANAAVHVYKDRRVELVAGADGSLQVAERTVYFLKAELRKTSIEGVPETSYRLTWWFAPCITGATWSQCSNGSSAVEAASVPITSLDPQLVGGSEARWVAPDLPGLGSGQVASYSLAAFIEPAANSSTIGTDSFYNSALSPDVQPGCGVRRITIVGG